MIDVRPFERSFRELDDLLLHLKGLVLVRALLEERGAGESELHDHDDAIEGLRARLASLGGNLHELAA